MKDWNIPSLRQYVKKCENKDGKSLAKAGFEWLKVSAKNRMDYELEWLGVPIIQTPEDIVLMQELIFGVMPDFVVETGIAHGGGLIFYASLMEVLGKGKVIGVDIEIRKHNRQVIENHPLAKRIELIEGDSAGDATLERVRKMIPEKSKVIVCLDSNHTKGHVLKELEAYRDFVIPGCYMVVFDTVTSKIAASGIDDEKYINNSPKEAVDEFLKNNRDFQVDKNFNRLFISTSPDGYLKRIK